MAGRRVAEVVAPELHGLLLHDVVVIEAAEGDGEDGDALVTDTLEQAKELAYSKNSNLRVKVTRVFQLFRLSSLTRIHQSVHSCSACS